MAQVKLLTGLSGPTRSCGPGEIWECGDDEAGRLIAAGYGIAVDGVSPSQADAGQPDSPASQFDAGQGAADQAEANGKAKKK